MPLLNIGFEKSFGSLFLNSNLDGLYSSKGSAYDANIELGLDLNLLSLSFGVRTLGGGADNDKLINFARFQSYYLKLIFLNKYVLFKKLDILELKKTSDTNFWQFAKFSSP